MNLIQTGRIYRLPLIISIYLILALLFASVLVSNAQATPTPPTINILPPTNILPRVTPGGIIQAFIRLILIAAFVIAFIVLLIGGVRWILAGGDKQAVEGAKGMVTGAIVGLFLVLSVWAIIVLIETFFGVIIIRTGTFELPSAQ
jgi:hypothetical protein